MSDRASSEMEQATTPLTDAPSLVAVARAARAIGDKALLRAARQLLRDQHGIELSFCRAKKARELVVA